MHQPHFPLTASPSWIFGLFLTFILIFHLLFLKVWKLTERGWKKIDYLWLGFAAIGLIAGAAEVRKSAARNQLWVENTYMLATYERLSKEIDFLNGPAVCRKFNRTQYSPTNFEDIQLEYDNICNFGRQLKNRLPSEPPPDLKELRINDRPKITDRALQDMLNDLDRLLNSYAEARKAYDQINNAQHSTEGEVVLSFSAPLLLALALALRITKVTGELKNKQT